MKEAIILCSGFGKRMKPAIKVPKALVPLNGTTLLAYQINWLRKHGIERVIVPSPKAYLTDKSIIWVKEKGKLGTGGAVKLAVSKVRGKKVYVMNGDDIVFYNPVNLWKQSYQGASILVKKPRSSYGKVVFDKGGNVIRFEEKPILPWHISLGHYVFEKKLIVKHFPDKGNLELQLMQRLADLQKLRVLEYDGLWFPINNTKQLENARTYLTLKRDVEDKEKAWKPEYLTQEIQEELDLWDKVD